ncbi:hypothetical protein BG015_002326 [Linnemannia schmuckeri]|uniref:Uncharacterized protein n=1 Tax=Linnemannia schmuckeri TaxID=64567 RepID=A0A9P5V5Y1_9FUNG|nr:hypothetical protein BG015_002326 [Linnemannia schmuckeri]
MSRATVLLCLILALSTQTLAFPAFSLPKPTATPTIYIPHSLHVRQFPVSSTTTSSPVRLPTSSSPRSSQSTTTTSTDETISPSTSLETTDTVTQEPTRTSTTSTDSTDSSMFSPTTDTPTTATTDVLSTVTTDIPTTATTGIPTTATTDVPTTAPTTDVPTTATIDVPTTAPTTDVPTTAPTTDVPTVSTEPVQPTAPTPETILTSTSSNPSQTPIRTSLTGTTTSSGIPSSTGTVSVSESISESVPLVPGTSGPLGTGTATPGPGTPLTDDNSRTWIIVGGATAAVLLPALICFFVIRRRKQRREKRRLFNINGGLDSLTSINRASIGGDNEENGNDDDDLDSERAFFMANPPARVRSPQSPHPDNHDLNIKAPLDQYEAQKFNWPTPVVVTDKHPQDHIRQQHLQRLLELQQEQLEKLNALVERYRVTYSRPQSPHSPVLSETRLSTRLSYFGVDDQLVFEDENQLTSEEIRRLELKGDERLEDMPLEEGPFRDQGEIEDDDVELQRLEVNHYHHGPFADQDDDTPLSVRNIFDDPNAVFEADFEVASIIIRSGSINLLNDSLELPEEQKQRHYDKGKGTASSIRDSDSFLGLPLSTRASTDDLRAGFSYRDSNSTLAASSTVRERYSDSIMDGSSTEYSTDFGSSSGSGGSGGGGSRHGSGLGSGSTTAGAVLVPGKGDRGSTPKRIQTGQPDLDLDRQREREQNEILLKAIAQVKAQYAEQYRQIHEDLANLQLE